MATSAHVTRRKTNRRNAQSEVVGLLPAPGEWRDEDSLWLTSRTNRLVELSDGWIEVLPLPTDQHQSILLFLYGLLRDFLAPAGGQVLVAPLRLRSGKFREPDLLALACRL